MGKGRRWAGNRGARSAPRTPLAVAGLTLVEMLVCLTIVSILAAVALPVVDVSIRRSKEVALKKNLMLVREAIDRFNDDCRAGVFSPAQAGVSRDCFPETLETLAEGVDAAGGADKVLRYLRRIPSDPFAEEGGAPAEHWEIRGYQDDYDSEIWSGDDVFDIRVKHDRKALDGSRYRDW